MEDIPKDTIARAAAGDEDASRAIIEQLHRPVLATIYRFLGPRFRADSEDVAQEIFLKIFRAIDRFDPERGVKFTTWIYTFVRNHCFDILKKKRLPTVSLTVGQSGEESQREVVDEVARTPGAVSENNELGEKISEALEALGEDQRMTFILREYEGMDYASIAEVAGVSEGTVKSRLHRAKQAMRSRLEPYLKAGA